MKFKTLIVCFVLCLGLVLLAAPLADFFPFNGAADNEIDHSYYLITGGLFPTGTPPNGDNGSGGTFRWISDDPLWGHPPINEWHKDDWFPENAGFALTLMMGDGILYDNNGIEDGSGAELYDYFDNAEGDDHYPLLYCGFSMTNNYDWVYATYFKLESETTFDTIIGYFDGNGFSWGPFDPLSPDFGYRMNIWSSYQDLPATRPTSYMPVENSFTGDVLTTDILNGAFSVSYTGVDRGFPSWLSNGFRDEIWRLVFKLKDPVTLQPGVYFFSHSAVVVQPVDIDVKPGDYPNSINLKSKGKVAVVLYGSDDFSVEDVAMETLFFAGASPAKIEIKDDDKDGYNDLIMHFNTQDLVLDESSDIAYLRGFTTGNTPFKGSDLVNIIPDKNKNK